MKQVYLKLLLIFLRLIGYLYFYVFLAFMKGSKCLVQLFLKYDSQTTLRIL